jgi:16S rRNA G966 N2-methylase RsmD
VKSYKLAALVKLNRSFVTDMNFNLEKYLMVDGLKHLLKSYSGQVKCIYIDPPYNTGAQVLFSSLATLGLMDW